MNTTLLYNEAYIKTRISEADFCRSYNECASYIAQKYGKKNVTYQPEGDIRIGKIGDESSLRDEFFFAVLSFFDYSKNESQNTRLEFLSACDTAYKEIRREKFKGARIRGIIF